MGSGGKHEEEVKAFAKDNGLETCCNWLDRTSHIAIWKVFGDALVQGGKRFDWLLLSIWQLRRMIDAIPTLVDDGIRWSVGGNG